MSTKIYEGYRCKLQNLEQALAYLRTRMWKKVLDQAKEWKLAPKIQAIDDFYDVFGGCGIHVWLDQDDAYIILYGHSRFTHFRSVERTLLESYRYWNNTDRPKSVSQKEWDSRRDTWYRVALTGDCWNRRITNIVFEKNDIDATYNLMQALRSNRKKA